MGDEIHSEVVEDDVGKKVVYGDDTVGRVVDFRNGAAYVEPDPGLIESLEAKLGWTDASDEEDAYPLQEEAVSRVTSDEVRLRTDL